MRQGDGEQQEDNLMELETFLVASTHVQLDASREAVVKPQESVSVNLVTMVKDVKINALKNV